jgi:hypothetical protein
MPAARKASKRAGSPRAKARAAAKPKAAGRQAKPAGARAASKATVNRPKRDLSALAESLLVRHLQE